MHHKVSLHSKGERRASLFLQQTIPTSPTAILKTTLSLNHLHWKDVLKALLARKSMKVMLLSNIIWHGTLSQPVINSTNLALFST